MKIGDKGYPIYASPRHNGGVTIFQSTSRILLSRDEVPELIKALQDLTNQ